MDFLLKEIAGMKRKVDETQSDVGRKWVKRSELQELEEKSQQREEFNEKVYGSVEGKQASKKDSDDKKDVDLEEDDEKMSIPKKEIYRRLRLRKEPITLFGEDLEDTYKRLRKLEQEEPLDVVLERQKNDFQAMMSAVDQKQMDEDARGTKAKESDTKKKYNWTEASRRVREELGKGTTKEEDQKIILYFWKTLQKMWETQLNRRSDAEKRSPEGRRALAVFMQNQQHLQPLFKHLKKRDLPEELIPLFTDIVQCVEAREYQKANDWYLRMSIGNAAWPIGVTQVGIHSRGGREKIFSQHIAHILNDETQRKYIHACKRLMTFCQTIFPADPSKSLEYKAMETSHLYPKGVDE